MPPPTEDEYNHKGVVPFLDPLPRFEITQPGNILRIFERGGKFRPEVGIPNRFEDPGRPILSRLSDRGLGTENRTDPTFLGLQKTRLLRPDAQLHWAPTTTPATTAPAAAPPATSSTPTTARVMNSGPYAKYGNNGPELLQRPDDPQGRAGPPHRPPLRQGQRHPDQPVHRLPHPPRHQRHEQLPRHHVVGRGDRRRADLPAGRQAPDGRGIHRSRRSSNPNEIGRPQQPVRPRVPGQPAAT